jgi:hypothetical protein
MSIYRDAHLQIKWSLLRERLIVLVALASLGAAVATLFQAVTQYGDLADKTTTAAVKLQGDTEVADLRRDVDHLRIRLQAIQEMASSGTRVSDEATQIRQVDARLGVIERGLVDTPEKALSVPMMRRDLVALERSSETQISSIRDDVARLYTLMLWLIGIIVTISLGLVGLIFALGRAKKDDASKSAS